MLIRIMRANGEGLDNSILPSLLENNQNLHKNYLSTLQQYNKHYNERMFEGSASEIGQTMYEFKHSNVGSRSRSKHRKQRPRVIVEYDDRSAQKDLLSSRYIPSFYSYVSLIKEAKREAFKAKLNKRSRSADAKQLDSVDDPYEALFKDCRLDKSVASRNGKKKHKNNGHSSSNDIIIKKKLKQRFSAIETYRRRSTIKTGRKSHIAKSLVPNLTNIDHKHAHTTKALNSGLNAVQQKDDGENIGNESNETDLKESTLLASYNFFDNKVDVGLYNTQNFNDDVSSKNVIKDVPPGEFNTFSPYAPNMPTKAPDTKASPDDKTKAKLNRKETARPSKLQANKKLSYKDKNQAKANKKTLKNNSTLIGSYSREDTSRNKPVNPVKNTGKKNSSYLFKSQMEAKPYAERADKKQSMDESNRTKARLDKKRPIEANGPKNKLGKKESGAQNSKVKANGKNISKSYVDESRKLSKETINNKQKPYLINSTVINHDDLPPTPAFAVKQRYTIKKGNCANESKNGLDTILETKKEAASDMKNNAKDGMVFGGNTASVHLLSNKAIENKIIGEQHRKIDDNLKYRADGPQIMQDKSHDLNGGGKQLDHGIGINHIGHMGGEQDLSNLLHSSQEIKITNLSSPSSPKKNTNLCADKQKIILTLNYDKDLCNMDYERENSQYNLLKMINMSNKQINNATQINSNMTRENSLYHLN